jgi:lipopolysaccharide export system permease protein
MKILHRYLITHIIATILLIMLVLVSIEMIVEFTKEVSDIGIGNYHLPQAFIYVVMILPLDIYQFFPMAGLLGALIGLGLLASRSELIIMRAAGVSVTKIATSVIMAACIVMIFALFLGEFLGPKAQHQAIIYKTTAVSDGQALNTTNGIWLRKQQDFINIGSVLPDGTMRNITRYKFAPDNTLQAISYAKSGEFTDKHWIFKDITSSKFFPAKVVTEQNATEEWPLAVKPHLLNLLNLDSNERTLPQLYSYIHYLRVNGLQTTTYEFILWQRLFSPLATIVMILLAVPFIFGPLRTVPMGLRILVGASIGLVVFTINQFIGPLTSVFELSPFIVAISPIILMAMLGVFLLLRVR